MELSQEAQMSGYYGIMQVAAYMSAVRKVSVCLYYQQIPVLSHYRTLLVLTVRVIQSAACYLLVLHTAQNGFYIWYRLLRWNNCS